MTTLSVLIPARNEIWLAKTIEDILAHREADTEVIAVLDGAWADPQIPDHPDVHLIYHSQSIGQRAATNEAAKLSRAKFVMKVDAHCAFDQGFDVKLMAPYRSGELTEDVTSVPIMRNLHVFDWVCPQGHRRYQGPSGPCEICGKETTRDIVWIAKPSPQSKAYCFDATPHFLYHREFSKRPEGKGELTETMSLQGSCVFMTRERFFELDGCDESVGSWGSFGVEIAAKSWLSGGRVVCNQRTWYAHCFRTQGKDFGFPYPLPQSQVESARQAVRSLFFQNAWPKQVRPLSWLVEKFAPVPGWSEEELAGAREAGVAFVSRSVLNISQCGADSTDSVPSVCSDGKTVAPKAVGFSSVGVSSPHIVLMRSESDMIGITAGRPIADEVIQFGNTEAVAALQRSDKPFVHDSMNELHPATEPGMSMPKLGLGTDPHPAFSAPVNFDLLKESSNFDGSKLVNREILNTSHAGHLQEGTRVVRAGTVHPHRLGSSMLTRGILFYTDNRLDPLIASSVQRQLKNSCNGYDIVSVSLQPIEFGHNVVLPLSRGVLTMFKQIVAGLETLETDIVYFAEHDCLYHPSHFYFIPQSELKYWYNQNVWKVDATSGHALFYYCNQTSGLCAYRDLLLEHYRKRVERVEREGFTRAMGFEAGTHRSPRGIDDYGHATWMSAEPNLDLRHANTLTKSRWRKEEFRNQKYTAGWTESDSVPGWGRTKGRMKEFLEEVR